LFPEEPDDLVKKKPRKTLIKIQKRRKNKRDTNFETKAKLLEDLKRRT
jgi:hypothetical protein